MLFGVAALFLGLVWGVGIEPRLIDVRHEVAQVPGLPPAWDGEQIALIADLQVGMWLGNTDTIRRIVARLVQKRPAAVLIAGDFIYHPLEDEPEDVREEYEPEEFRTETLDEMRAVVDLLQPLVAARIPTYAVLGNHDYGIKTRTTPPLPWLASEVAEALEKLGVRVLINEAVAMTPPTAEPPMDGGGRDLFLVGLGSRLAGQDHPAEALAGLPAGAPRLVLMHNPDSFADVPAGTAPVAMAGHTHGGQLRIPFLPNWSIWSIIRQKELHMDGWIPDYGEPGNRLYVNRGIGFSELPIRINCPPELTFFTLRAEQ